MAAAGELIPLEQTNPFRSHASRPPSYTTLPRRRSNSTPMASSKCGATPNIIDMPVADQDRPRRHASQNNHRRSHRHRSSRVRPDTIDKLDTVSGVRYHHEGPYDAVYPERNQFTHRSPVAAVKETNDETLKATPMYKIMDSIQRHRPLDGVGFYPPGTADEEGHVYDYKEGDNMMTEREGNFKRDPGMVCAFPCSI
jgi:hypothetical protein